MLSIDHEVERFLTLIRNKIRERGYTQLEVQESLGWGRSYISQLLTRQKGLRVEQVLSMLDIIGVEPASFFAELYGSASIESAPQNAGVAELRRDLREMRTLLRGLVDLLVDNNLIQAEELRQQLGSE